MRFYPAFLVAAMVIAAAGCHSSTAVADSSGGGADPDTKHIPELIKDDTVVGKGEAVENGDEVWVKYTGKLKSGKVFDTTEKAGGSPFHVSVGEGMVIRGWDLGLVGMKLGGKRKLSIPYKLAYGDKPSGKDGAIPAKSDLYFDIEIVQLLKQKDSNTITVDIVKDGKGRKVKKGDTVTISYVATTNGVEFENSKDLKKPPVFTIGGGKMTIPNFDDALIGMQVGGERQIHVPPSLNRVLHSEKLGMGVATFDVTLVSIK